MIRKFEDMSKDLELYSDTHQILSQARGLLAEDDLPPEVRYTINELCTHIEGLYPLARELHRTIAGVLAAYEADQKEAARPMTKLERETALVRARVLRHWANQKTKQPRKTAS